MTIGQGPLVARTATVAVLPVAAVLVGFGNGASGILAATASLPGGSWSFVGAGLLLAAVSLAFARGAGLDAAGLGLRGRPLRGAALGALAGSVAAAAAVVLLRTVAPVVVGGDLAYAPLAGLGAGDLARHVGVFLLLGTVLPEELAFRGVLLGALMRVWEARVAVAASALAFALWHAVSLLGTISVTTLAPPSPWSMPALAAALLAVAAGGATFAWLRLRSGTLLAPIAAHWAFNAVVLVGLWLPGAL